jgi:hypothetical protein
MDALREFLTRPDEAILVPILVMVAGFALLGRQVARRGK